MSKRPSIPQLESPRVKRPNLESGLEEKWKTMNEIVHLLVQSYRDSSSISGDKLLAITLMQIQVFCPPGTWKKPLGTSDCQKLVEDNPHIIQALEKAIESGHYEEILSLRWPLEDICFPYSQSVLIAAVTGEDCTTDEEEEETDFEPTTTGAAATIAWTTKYNGKCHEVLLKNINSAYRSEARTSATVIQSSGTGKSRTVHELAALVFTIPFNLRHPADGWAYPPTDRKVWKYLCDVSNVKSVKHGEAHTAFFFDQVFTQVTEEVKKLFRISEDKLSPDDLARRWREHLSLETRYFLYEKIVEGCKEHEARLNASFQIIVDESVVKLNLLLEALESICAFPKSDDVRVMLYFDEAHELGHAIPSDKQKRTMYDVVCSSLSSFRHCGIFALFLSTQFSLGLSAPSTEMSQLARQRRVDSLQAPFTEMPFDCHPTFPLRPETLRLKDLEDLAFLARFGRPLFWTMIEVSKGENRSILIEGTMELARAKLVRSHGIYGQQFSSLAMLATLDVLVAVDYKPRWDLFLECEMEMVASHMRIAFSVPQDQSYICSGYPSEPFLAEAASCQMYHYLQDQDHTMVQLLWKNLHHDLIALDRNGEVVMRLLLRMAYMQAIVAEQVDENHSDHELNFSKGCNVLQFLKALFGDQYHDEILMSKPDNSITSTCALAGAFEHAVVRFTHFVKAVDESVMSTQSMVSGFLRGVAFICHNRQNSIDIIIPILLDKCSVLKESSMSALFVQVKRRRQRTAYIIGKENSFFPRKVSTREQAYSRPYMTLVAELGIDDPLKTRSLVVTGSNAGKSFVRARSKSTEEHPRYGIRAYGCTEATWKVIRDPEGDTYKRILSTDDILADHPRQDKDSLELVHRMLPFWDDDPLWYTHGEPTESDFTNTDESLESTEEGSEVED
ncbi:hypothetical protein F5141DRAFT_1231205 [Pisolithus sp. B1]|nr:hypothetical protein F5141DRAFT_1231205 [Pisolithus sp. B1]